MCGSFSVQKYGRKNGRQRYRCNKCHELFQSAKRPSKRAGILWKSYVLRRSTLADLSSEDGRSTRQLQRVLRKESARKRMIIHTTVREPVVLVLDTTYFDSFGVMVFRCATRRRNLFWTFVSEETNEAYLSGIEHLQKIGFKIVAVVCDGKRWLAEQIRAKGIPVQLCQFHFAKTMTKHLTKHPKTKASRALRSLALRAKFLDEESFASALASWNEEYKNFLLEKTVTSGTGRWQYTHRNVRAAHRTALHWLPCLFTCKKFPELNISNTTNTLDGTFSHVKNKVQVHRGLNDETKRKMINLILAQPSLPKRWKNQPKSVV